MKRFGGFRALDGVSFHLAAGEVLGLVGPNGSGKTTCINVISGLYAPDGGERAVRGPLDRRPQIAPAGAARHQPHLPVAAAVPVADACARTSRSPRTYGNSAARRSTSTRCSPRWSSTATPTAAAGDLNSAQQKTLDLARALATAPRLLLVDELAAGLNPAELGRMADRLRALAHDGMALLVVEHLMGFIDKVTDRVIVMNAGREIFEGTLAEATRDPKVVRVFLGGHAA